MEHNLQVDDELFVDIKRLGINGEGIAFYKKLTIFVKDALPKENVFVKITKVNNKYANAEIKELKVASKDRCNHFCEYYTKCGGCSLQHLSYEASGALKRDILMESISRYTSLNPRSFEIKPTILMKNPMEYRAKANLPARIGEHGTVFGLYAPNSTKFVRVKKCYVQDERINEIALSCGKALDSLAISAYDLKNEKGFVKFIVVRISKYSGDAQVTYILNRKPNHLDELGKLTLKITNVVSVYYSINDVADETNIFGKEINKIAGEDFIIEAIGDLKYELYPNSFFQLNPSQTEILYEEVKKACKLSKKENVIDAYCGVGTIGLYLAKYAKEVVGIESNKQAIINANENADLNGITNCRFIEGDASNVLPYLAKDRFIPDIMIFDPPRSGLSDEVKKTVLKVLPRRIVYVSCNPSTLAKDLESLKNNYSISYIQPVDMFPFTSHVESVCVMYKKDA